MTPFIATRSGRWHFECPQPEDVDLADIAFALAHTHRFLGHAGAYSVASHSLHVARIVTEQLGRPELALEALLHDAHEAYVGDVSAPLKRLLPDYCALERMTERVVRRAFGLGETMSDEVRRADVMALEDEAAAFFTGWTPGPGSGLRIEQGPAGLELARWLGAVERGLR